MGVTSVLILVHSALTSTLCRRHHRRRRCCCLKVLHSPGCPDLNVDVNALVFIATFEARHIYGREMTVCEQVTIWLFFFSTKSSCVAVARLHCSRLCCNLYAVGLLRCCSWNVCVCVLLIFHSCVPEAYNLQPDPGRSCVVLKNCGLCWSWF